MLGVVQVGTPEAEMLDTNCPPEQTPPGVVPEILVTVMSPPKVMVASPSMVRGAYAVADWAMRICPASGAVWVPVPPYPMVTGGVRLRVVAVAVSPAPAFRVANAPTGVPPILVTVLVYWLVAVRAKVMSPTTVSLSPVLAAL